MKINLGMKRQRGYYERLNKKKDQEIAQLSSLPTLSLNMMWKSIYNDR